MSVTLAYDSQLSRVRISADGLGAALTARVERSTNQVTWSTVRGGVAAAVASGALAVPVDDYEFAAGATNYYRVVTPDAPQFIAAGTAAHANNASVSPALPAGWAQDDVLLVLAAIRNSGAGVPVQPAGYVTLVDAGNMKLFGKIAGSSESAPTITFTGGVANADTSAQMAAVRKLTLEAVTVAATALNASAQNIGTPQLTFEAITEGFVLWPAWKQDDWTSVTPVSNGTEIGEPSTTTGDDQGITWAYWSILPTTEFTTIGARTFTVTGGASAISRAATLVLEPASLVQSNSITPVLTDVWIKDIGKPFLNRAVKPLKYISWGRRSRGGVFDVVGRSLPVAVTDVRSGREGLTLQILVDSAQERDDLDLAFASGDPIFLHCPPDYPVSSMYVFVGDTDFNEFRGVLTLPLIEVAAPTPDVVGATNTYQSILNSYATYTALLAGEPTYKDVVQRIGAPSDVLVP